MQICKLYKMDYSAALSLQKKALDLRGKNQIADTLLLVEHPPVLNAWHTPAKEQISLRRKRCLRKTAYAYMR